MEHYKHSEQLTLQLQPCIPPRTLVVVYNYRFHFTKTQIKPYKHCRALLPLENLPHGDTEKKSQNPNQLNFAAYITLLFSAVNNIANLAVALILTDYGLHSLKTDRCFVLDHYHEDFFFLFFLLFCIKWRVIIFHFSPVRFTAPF